MSERETRHFGGSLEFREETTGDGRNTLSGWAPKWNRWSQPMPIITDDGDVGEMVERFAPGAFTNLEDDILVTMEHDNARLLGRTQSGTATVESTESGLRYQVSLPETSTGNDLRELIKRGDVSGSSFEFIVNPDGQELEKKGKRWRRTVTDARLFQVGPVVKPAYPKASSVTLRCLIDQVESDKVAAAGRERRLRLAEAEGVES